MPEIQKRTIFVLQKTAKPTPQQVEFGLYRTRPDLWAIAAALRNAKQYREAIWNLLDDADQEALRAHKKVWQAAHLELVKSLPGLTEKTP